MVTNTTNVSKAQANPTSPPVQPSSPATISYADSQGKTVSNVITGSYIDKNTGRIVNYAIGGDINQINSPANQQTEQVPQTYTVQKGTVNVDTSGKVTGITPGETVQRTNVFDQSGHLIGYSDVPVALSGSNPSVTTFASVSPSNSEVAGQVTNFINESGAFANQKNGVYVQDINKFNQYLTNQQFELAGEQTSLTALGKNLNTSNAQDVNNFNSKVKQYNLKATALNELTKAFNSDILQRNAQGSLINEEISGRNNFINLINPENIIEKPTIPTGVTGINLTQPLANPVTHSTITNEELLHGVNPNLLDKGSNLYPLSPTNQIISSVATFGGVAFVSGAFGEFLAVSETTGINFVSSLGIQGSKAIVTGQIASQVATGGLQGGSIYVISKLSGSSNKQALDLAGYGLVSPVGKIAGITATEVGFSGLGASGLALESSLLTGGITTYNVAQDVGGFKSIPGKIALIGGTFITGLASYSAFSETIDLNKALSKPVLQPQINERATSYESSVSTPSQTFKGAIDVRAVKGTIGSFETSEGLVYVKSTTSGPATVFENPLAFVSEPSESGEILFPSGTRITYELPNTVVRGFPGSQNEELLTSVYSNEGLTPYKSGLAKATGVTEESVANTNIPVRSVSGLPIPSQLNEFTQEEFSNLIEIKGLSVSSNIKIFFQGIETSTGETPLGVSTSGVNLKGISLTSSGKGLTETPITVEENTLVTNIGESLKGATNTFKTELPLTKEFSGGLEPFSQVSASNELIFQESRPANNFEVINTEERQAVIVRGIQGSMNEGTQEIIRNLPNIQEVSSIPARQVMLSDIVKTEEAYRTSLTRPNYVPYATVLSEGISSSVQTKSSSSSIALQQLKSSSLLSELETRTNQQSLLNEVNISKSPAKNERIILINQEVQVTQNLEEQLSTNFKLENLTSTQQELQQLQELQTQQLTSSQFQLSPTSIIAPPLNPPNLQGKGGIKLTYKTPKKTKRSKRQRNLVPVDFNYTDLLSQDASFYLTGRATKQSYRQRRKEFYYPGNTGGIILTKELKKYYKSGSKIKIPKLPKFSLKGRNSGMPSFKKFKFKQAKIRGFNFGNTKKRKSSRIL